VTFAEYLQSELKSLDEHRCVEDEEAPEPGEICPTCNVGVLEYDGMLNLVCTECNYVSAGVCT
jgi:hypothetical protein